MTALLHACSETLFAANVESDALCRILLPFNHPDPRQGAFAILGGLNETSSTTYLPQFAMTS